MTFRPDLSTPFGYGRDFVTLAWLYDWLLEHHEPEYVERLIAYLDHRDGLVGVGGGWRATQPVKPGFAPPGKSFHEDQTFCNGFVGAAAIDGVRRDPNGGVHLTPRWGDFPEQYTPESIVWGIHANLQQTSSNPEPWHIQPIEIDGWQSWVNDGRPAPAVGYPFPGRTPQPTPDPAPVPEPPEEDEMSHPTVYLAYHVDSGGELELWRGDGLNSEQIDASTRATLEGRKFTDPRMSKFRNPKTNAPYTSWDEVSEVVLTSVQVWADLGHPR